MLLKNHTIWECPHWFIHDFFYILSIMQLFSSIFRVFYILYHFLVNMYMCSVAQLCPTLCDPMDCSPPGSSVHGDSPGKNIGVGCLALLQGIFPTQGLNPGLLHCRWILYHLSHQGSPRILEWVAYHFSRRSSQPTNQTSVYHIAGGFFTKLSYQGSPSVT